jgi:UDP-glucose 4-epimerase
MSKNLKSSVVTITGGTGSFGSTMVKGLIKQDVAEIRIFSRDENKQDSMRNSIKDERVRFFIGDVRDASSVENVMKGTEYVFHAAALKQVPSCEFFPMQASMTNVTGSSNVLDAAIKAGVKSIVCLSTDKSVYPINAMGISKAMMEKFMVAKSRIVEKNKTILCATRYGNVMASRGSVIPLLIEQLKSGKPLTITDPKMTRFLMSLEDSVELVLHAFEHAHQGDIFVQKSPASTVQDLAFALKDLFDRDNQTQIIGTRHGEKLYETLISREEMVRAEDMGKYYRISADGRDLNYAQYFDEGEQKISDQTDYTSHNTNQLTIDEVKKMLMKLEYIKEQLDV